MLTNFFGKSSPINFIICGVYLLIGFFASFFFKADVTSESLSVVSKLGLLGLLVFSMLLLNFIIRKNTLTLNNTYATFLFVCMVVMVPAIFNDMNTVGSNVFLLLALRRMASLVSERNMEKKLLDASLYITIAGLFHSWSLVFFLPLYWVLFRSSSNSFRMFLIPFVGLSAILIFAITYHLVMNDSLAWFTTRIPAISFDFASYNSARLLIPTAFIATLFIWTMVYRILRVGNVQRKHQQNYMLLVWVLLVCLGIGFLSPENAGSELLYVCGPLAITTANYLEKITDRWFKEVLLWLVVILPIVLLFL